MDSSKKTGIANIIRFYSAWRGMNSGLAGIFAITIIGVFPLVFRDYYFDILNFKTIFYCLKPEKPGIRGHRAAQEKPANPHK